MVTPAITTSVDTLPESSIRAIAAYGIAKADVIPLWFGESDIATPAFIRDAAQNALDAGETFYTPSTGLPALREELARYQNRLYGRDFSPDNITVTLSGMNALMLAMQCCVAAGDKVVTIEPIFPNLRAMPALLGARVHSVALSPSKGRFSLDLDRLFEAAADAKAIIINSPNNPTGWTATAAEIAAIADFARARGIWVIADEVYARLVYEGNVAPSFCGLLDDGDRIIVANSFSKAWCMTGWRLGWITAPKSLQATFRKLIEFNVSCAPAFTQQAGLAALCHGEAFLASTLARYSASRSTLIDRLGEWTRAELYRPDATFYAFLRVEGLGRDSMPFIHDMIDTFGVGVAPGEAFGEAGRGCLRLCYAIEPQRLALALDRMAPLFK